MVGDNITSGESFAQSLAMPGLDFTDPAWATNFHNRPLLRAHKQLPRRNPQPLPIVDLRSHYRKPVDNHLKDRNRCYQEQSTTSPVAPQTASYAPPLLLNVEREPSDHGRDDSSTATTTIFRSSVATPTCTRGPPTPDVTPPRAETLAPPPFLLADAPSISSRAQSFKTAREEISSDDGLGGESPLHRPARQKWLHYTTAARADGCGSWPSPLSQNDETLITLTVGTENNTTSAEDFAMFDGSWHAKENAIFTPARAAPTMDMTITTANSEACGSPQAVLSHPSMLPTPPTDNDERTARMESTLRGMKDSQGHLREARATESSDYEGLMHESGWLQISDSPNLQNRVNSWRWSGISTSSTVEAIVVDAEASPHRRQKLRHSRKNPSLRSTSSPFPSSNRDSLLSNTDSPHRLVHKRGQISNKSRWSVGSSPVARSNRASFETTKSPPRSDIVRVAVIPERSSPSSQNHSRKHSALPSSSSQPKNAGNLPESSPGDRQITLGEKRAMSMSLPAEGGSEARRQNGQLLPSITALGHPVSASVSRSASRAESTTSEQVRLRRLAAEEDLHRTLEQMESTTAVIPPDCSLRTHNEAITHPIRPNIATNDTGELSFQYLPFSPHSMDSALSGSVEMGQAQAVNLFAHNNHSLQIVDQAAQPEVRPVSWSQISGGNRDQATVVPSTPTRRVPPKILTGSPLRHPRDPPEPPALKVIPATPAHVTSIDNSNHQVDMGSSMISRKSGSLVRRFGSLKRTSPGSKLRSDSVVRSLGRSLSLRNTRNRKANEDLDANLHPFWRPRGFWDDIGDTDSEGGFGNYHDDVEDVVVSNSLGVPQKRAVINGPMSLVRHLSGSSRRQRPRSVTKRSSQDVLPRLQGGRKVYKEARTGHGLHFSRFRDVKDRLQLPTWRREDGKREQSRQAIRDKIHPHVISTGDSRYPPQPAAMVSTRARIRG